MLIDLIEILQKDNSVKRISPETEMKQFQVSGFEYKVKDSDISYVFTNAGKKCVNVVCEGKVILQVPCDRCLEPVDYTIDINVSRDMDTKKTAEEKIADLDEENYLDGTIFDTEVFIFNEILVNLPMKVLCSKDCKGICNRCGANLNKGVCDCDTAVPDPRMSKILDVFNQFKEV